MQNLRRMTGGLGGAVLAAGLATVVPGIAQSQDRGSMRSIGRLFCIDRYEATVASNGQAVSAAGVTPSVNVSQVEAEAACQKAGKRLCTAAEWLRACGGPDGSLYPYGNSYEPGACNDTTGAVALTGEFDGCVGAEAVNDMVGNVGEWIADPNGTFRGGYFSDAWINGYGCQYVTTAHDVSHRDPKTGFRCCSDVVEDKCPSSGVVEVLVDVKPGSSPNCFNLDGHGVIPVAVLGSAALNVNDIDQVSLSFGGLEVRVRGNKGPQCSLEDANDDSFLDLVCQFEDDTTNWSAGASDRATLTGRLLDGTAIEGSDSDLYRPLRSHERRVGLEERNKR